MMKVRFSAISKNEIKAKAQGMWGNILATLAPAIAPALAKPGLQHIDCPMHGGKNDFRVYRDVEQTGGGVCTCGNWPDGFALVGAVNGWPFKETLAEVGRVVLGEMPAAVPYAPTKRDIAKEDEAIRQRLAALWKASLPLALEDASQQAACLYLKNRGLVVPRTLDAVRFHPSMAYYEGGQLQGHFPGLLACVTAQDGTPVTLHRTFLTQEGQKAQVSSPKKLCSHTSYRSLKGVAIRLAPVQETLAVAEGIETALAVMELTGIPCWATVTAGLMAEFKPPQQVRKVVIFADKDAPNSAHPHGHGQEAAKRLAKRLWEQGVQTSIRIPPCETTGVDWLDVLVGIKNLKVA